MAHQRKVGGIDLAKDQNPRRIAAATEDIEHEITQPRNLPHVDARSVMALIVIQCSSTGRNVSTELAADQPTWNALPPGWTGAPFAVHGAAKSMPGRRRTRG
jgi:hypothetical protein